MRKYLVSVIVLFLILFLFVSNTIGQEKSTANMLFAKSDSLAHTIETNPVLTIIDCNDVDTTGKAEFWKFGYKDFAIIASLDSVSIDTSFEWLTGTAALFNGWIDSDSALSIAEKNGGIEFRKTYSDWSIYSDLASPSGNPFITQWQVIYSRKIKPKVRLLVIIDAIHGVLESSSLSDVEEEKTVPTFYLYQNYPNPFNPSTTIRYHILETNNVTLKIFDIHGKTVKIFNKGLQMTGEYRIDLFLDDLPSGLYFYQLQAGKHIITKKFIKTM